MDNDRIIETLGKIQFSDGSVQSVHSDGSRLVVEWTDWKDRKRLLVFRDVIGYQGLSIEQEALSHGLAKCSEDLIDQASEAAAEEKQDYACFLLFSAWNDKMPLFKVVAKAFEERSGPGNCPSDL